MRVDFRKLKNSRRVRKQLVCMVETTSMLNCIAITTSDGVNTRCAKEIAALNTCMAAVKSGRKSKHKPTTNYHVLRLSKKMLGGKK